MICRGIFKTLTLAIGALFISLSASYAIAAECDAAKPNLQIAQPPSSAGLDVAAFSGVWDGTFTLHGKKIDALLCSRLYVSVKDNANAATAICFGSLNGNHPYCDQQAGQFSGGQLSFATTGNQYSAKVTSPGKMMVTAAGVRRENETAFEKEP
jgi:hypothetical protein